MRESGGSDAKNLLDFAVCGEIDAKSYEILLFVGDVVLFLAVFRWLGGGRWLHSMPSAFAADDEKSGFF